MICDKCGSSIEKDEECLLTFTQLISGKTNTAKMCKKCGILFTSWFGQNSTSIDDFDFSIRTQNCLRMMNIFCVEDLIKYSPRELLKNKFIGRKSLKEIEDKLKEKDLFLKG